MMRFVVQVPQRIRVVGHVMTRRRSVGQEPPEPAVPAPAEQDKIFEKFYRCGDPLVHNTKGSGLGLSLVRHIAQAHGGNVSVESSPLKGSKFTIALPINLVPREGHATA